MSALAFFLILLTITVVVVVGGMAYGHRSSTLPRLTREERRKAKALEVLVIELRETAYAFRDTDPNLSFEITDRINKFQANHLKELGN